MGCCYKIRIFLITTTLGCASNQQLIQQVNLDDENTFQNENQLDNGNSGENFQNNLNLEQQNNLNNVGQQNNNQLAQNTQEFEEAQNNQGENINNQQGNEFADNNFLQPNQGEQQNNDLTEDQQLNQENTDNNEPIQQQIFQSQNVNQPMVDTEINQNVTTNLITGGVVRYILPGGASVYQNASSSSKREGLMEQGDHPLVLDNGEWSRTSDGYYIPSSKLTQKGIGRAKIPSLWR